MESGARKVSERPLVLVVDDEDDYRELIGELLLGCGYGVVTCRDGHEALRYLSSDAAARPDLVVTDLEMPRVDGAALVAAIAARDDLAGLGVLLVTGRDLPSLPGAQVVLRKPVDVDALLGTVQALLDRSVTQRAERA